MAQLVARYLGVVEAAGSSPVTQTKKRRFYAVYRNIGVFAFSLKMENATFLLRFFQTSFLFLDKFESTVQIFRRCFFA